jgi:putative flippase GtrA
MASRCDFGDPARRAGGVLLAQLRRFLGASALATACQYLTLVLAVELRVLEPVPASCAAYLVGANVNYHLRRRYVFRVTAAHLQHLAPYLAVTLAGFALNGLIVALVAQVEAAPYLAAQVAATGIVFGWNFLAHKLWTFRA